MLYREWKVAAHLVLVVTFLVSVSFHLLCFEGDRGMQQYAVVLQAMED